MKDDRKYLIHILESIRRIEEDISGGRTAEDEAGRASVFHSGSKRRFAELHPLKHSDWMYTSRDTLKHMSRRAQPSMRDGCEQMPE